MLNCSGDKSPSTSFPYNRARHQPCRRSHMGTEVCYRWNCICPECRHARLNSEVDRIRLGIDEMNQRGDNIWFITLTAADKSQPTYTGKEIRDFSSRVSDLLTALQKSAKADSHNLLRVSAFGTKTREARCPYQLHAHVIASYVPDAKLIQDKLYESAKLSDTAQKLGLSVHLELTNSPDAVARYLAVNLKELEDIEFPKGFRRLNYSRSWPKAAWQIRKQTRQENQLAEGIDVHSVPTQDASPSILSTTTIYSTNLDLFTRFTCTTLYEIAYATPNITIFISTGVDPPNWRPYRG